MCENRVGTTFQILTHTYTCISKSEASFITVCNFPLNFVLGNHIVLILLSIIFEHAMPLSEKFLVQPRWKISILAEFLYIRNFLLDIATLEQK